MEENTYVEITLIRVFFMLAAYRGKLLLKIWFSIYSSGRFCVVDEDVNVQEHRNVAFNPYRAAFNYNVEIDYSSQQIVAIEPMNIACQYCKAFKFKNEDDGLCCMSGQVKLTPLIPLWAPLVHSLVSGNGPHSKLFFNSYPAIQ